MATIPFLINIFATCDHAIFVSDVILPPYAREDIPKTIIWKTRESNPGQLSGKQVS